MQCPKATAILLSLPSPSNGPLGPSRSADPSSNVGTLTSALAKMIYVFTVSRVLKQSWAPSVSPRSGKVPLDVLRPFATLRRQHLLHLPTHQGFSASHKFAPSKIALAPLGDKRGAPRRVRGRAIVSVFMKRPTKSGTRGSREHLGAAAARRSPLGPSPMFNPNPR